jgi:hypothetical protein
MPSIKIKHYDPFQYHPSTPLLLRLQFFFVVRDVVRKNVNLTVLRVTSRYSWAKR